MSNPVIKVWLREPRKAWRNDGGLIPRGFRALAERRGIKSHSIIIRKTGERVRRGHYIVKVGGIAYGFSAAEMKRLYSRIPL